MASPKTVVVFLPVADQCVKLTEHPHPADARFLAYQRGDGQWLSVDHDGTLSFSPLCQSYQAFVRTTSGSYLLADRTAFPLDAPRGGVYRLGVQEYTEPAGPVA